MGANFFPGIFTTLKSKVARGFVSDSILKGSCKAAPPRCDPKRGQRGGQCGSFSSSNGSSVAGTGRSAGLCPSSRIMPTIWSSTCSSTGRGAATRCSAGNLASSRVAGSKIRSAWRSGAPGGIGVDRAGAARWLRAGAARSEVGESSLALNRSGAPGRVGVGRVGAARRFRGGAARGGIGESSLALNRQPCRKRDDSSCSATDSAFDSAFIPYARLFSLHPSLVSNNSCGVHGVGAMNSCGCMHDVVMHDNSSVHVNSCGALEHRNSCHVHAAEVRRGTKAPSMSTRLGVWCPAVEKLASPQQAPGSLHGEVWTSILQNQGPKIFREVEIVPGCAVTVPVLHVLIILLSHLGQAE